MEIAVLKYVDSSLTSIERDLARKIVQEAHLYESCQDNIKTVSRIHRLPFEVDPKRILRCVRRQLAELHPNYVTELSDDGKDIVCNIPSCVEKRSRFTVTYRYDDVRHVLP